MLKRKIKNEISEFAITDGEIHFRGKNLNPNKILKKILQDKIIKNFVEQGEARKKLKNLTYIN